MTLTILITNLCHCGRLSTFGRVDPPACITADVCGHFSCVVALPHLALWRKSIAKMIRSQPSVMAVMVKSIGEYEDESIPCRRPAGSLSTERKTIHGSSRSDRWCYLEGTEDMLYDTATVTTFPALKTSSRCCSLFVMLIYNSWLISVAAAVDFIYALFIQGGFAEHEQTFLTNALSQYTSVTQSHTCNLPSVRLIVMCTEFIRTDANHLPWGSFLTTKEVLELRGKSSN